MHWIICVGEESVLNISASIPTLTVQNHCEDKNETKHSMFWPPLRFSVDKSISSCFTDEQLQQLGFGISMQDASKVVFRISPNFIFSKRNMRKAVQQNFKCGMKFHRGTM